jgi:hypothetical protein
VQPNELHSNLTTLKLESGIEIGQEMGVTHQVQGRVLKDAGRADLVHLFADIP